MIQLNISGRAGNQMFQYATVRAFMKRYQIEDQMQISFALNEHQNFKNELENFNVHPFKIVPKNKLNFFQYVIFQIYRINRKIVNIKAKKQKKDCFIENRKLQLKWQKLLNFFGIYHFLYGYCELKNSFVKNKLFEGYFESSRYFDEIKEELMLEFTPKYDKLEKNKKLYQLIEETNSVCVTIRRGDFLEKENKDRFYICTPEYFQRGIEYMQSKLNNPQFVIFSDDIEWCKEHMKFPFGTAFEDGTDPVWEKLRLMYSCKHFIISNSTFSWWAQHLSRNHEKIVVAPDRWSKFGYTKDIYEKNWRTIEGS